LIHKKAPTLKKSTLNGSAADFFPPQEPYITCKLGKSSPFLKIIFLLAIASILKHPDRSGHLPPSAENRIEFYLRSNTYNKNTEEGNDEEALLSLLVVRFRNRGSGYEVNRKPEYASRAYQQISNTLQILLHKVISLYL
tara:strand:+ start:147 stop:563 length:417 start_codon:yes stop_codon:yes gene_type:complete